MATGESAREVLRSAETALRVLMERAMSEQRYIDVAEAAQLADGVARLLGSSPSATEQTTREPAQSTKKSVPSEPQKVARKITPRKIPQNTKYPRFERDGNRLVKVGWSKKHRDEYEHRAPKDAVVAFIRYLTGTVSDDRVFVADELMPAPAIDGNDEVPAYQVYLTLKWLQHIGFVQKKGRDGYILQSSNLAKAEFEELWVSLPERKHQKLKGK